VKTTTGGTDDEPIKHHYVMVLVVEALTITALYLLSRFYR
jgi:hypothetical protein